MNAKSLSPTSLNLMGYLISNETIANKVRAAGKEGKSYSIIDFSDTGEVMLGETKTRWWNKLIGCQYPLTFEAFSTCVWDALVDLSTGDNQEALLKGLSKEILIQAQREKKYDYIIERLVDCYRHVCNKKGDQPLEGGRGKSGHNGTTCEEHHDNVNVNVNFDGHRKTFRFPDSMNAANLVVEVGVTGVSVEK